jgi:hypothetical protein
MFRGGLAGPRTRTSSTLVAIQSNAALTSLAGLASSGPLMVMNLHVGAQPNLTTLAGLRVTSHPQGSGADVNVFMNPRLPQCEVDQLAGPSITLFGSGNDTQASCE